MGSELERNYADKEATYITLGRLEDIFLNPFVSAVVKEENKLKGLGSPYDVQFNSIKGKVRWESNLASIQTAPLHPNEDLLSFMLPVSWTDSYNEDLKAIQIKNENKAAAEQEEHKKLLRAVYQETALHIT